MLRYGIVVLVIVAILWMVAGRLYIGGIGLGLGLIVAWYLLERERPEPAATEEDLSSLEEVLHETPAELTLPEFDDLLRRVMPFLTRGFGESGVERLVSLAERLRLQRDGQIEFQVVYLGQPTSLRVSLFKDNLETISVTFHSSQMLVNLLKREIAATAARRKA